MPLATIDPETIIRGLEHTVGSEASVANINAILDDPQSIVTHAALYVHNTEAKMGLLRSLSMDEVLNRDGVERINCFPHVYNWFGQNLFSAEQINRMFQLLHEATQQIQSGKYRVIRED